MDFSYFIGKKLATSGNKSFTTLIIRLAIAGVGISVAVMLLSVGIVKGFQSEIRDKVVGFEGHIQIRNLDLNLSKELVLIPKEQEFAQELKKSERIDRLSPFCSKAGIINTANEIEGMLFKGVPANYDWKFLAGNLKKGRLPNLTDSSDTYELILSQSVANRLKLDTGSRVEVFFIQDGKVRRRRFDLVGIFNTGLAEFDRTVCYTDMRVIQRIYTPDYNMVSGYEIYVKDLDRLEETASWIDGNIGIKLRAESVDELHPIIFQWLKIVDSNAIIIIILMTIVAVINLITAFLILILNRTRMIGVLKALGSTNGQVVRIFLVNGFLMIIPGLLIGNVLGLGLAWLQKTFHLFKLPEETYYMSDVPILLTPEFITMINLGTLVICFVMLLIPALLVRAITPVKAIRFD